MMRKVTKVFNNTDVVIDLRQGSANVFHTMHSLSAGTSYAIIVDEGATYREYLCAMQPDTPGSERVVFSSDDCAEFSKVQIYKEDGKYQWKGTEKRSQWQWRNTPVPGEDRTQPTTPVPPVEESTPAPTPAPAEDLTQPTTPVPPVEDSTAAITPTPPKEDSTSVPSTWWKRVTGFSKKKG